MPSHGGSSGKHVAQFRLPQSVKYTETGGYSTDGSEALKAFEGPVFSKMGDPYPILCFRAFAGSRSCI